MKLVVTNRYFFSCEYFENISFVVIEVLYIYIYISISISISISIYIYIYTYIYMYIYICIYIYIYIYALLFVHSSNDRYNSVPLLYIYYLYYNLCSAIISLVTMM